MTDRLTGPRAVDAGDDGLRRAADELELTARMKPSDGHARAETLLADPAVRADPVLAHRADLVRAECRAAMTNDEAAVDAIRAALD